jgi:hypothetical protein
MPLNNPESSPHTSTEDCTEADTVQLSEDYVMQSAKIARLGECIECGRKFERVWLYSHDQSYEPEYEEVNISPRPH